MASEQSSGPSESEIGSETGSNIVEFQSNAKNLNIHPSSSQYEKGK